MEKKGKGICEKNYALIKTVESRCGHCTEFSEVSPPTTRIKDYLLDYRMPVLVISVPHYQENILSFLQTG
jgi:hypothetical protein